MFVSAKRPIDSQRRTVLVAAALVLPLLTLYLLLSITVRPAQGSNTVALQASLLTEPERLNRPRNGSATGGIFVTPTSGLVTTEAGGVVTFTVVLTSTPAATVTIPLTSSNLSEGVVSPAALTFLTTTWNISQTVTVTGVDDWVDDGSIPYTIVTGAADSEDSGYDGLNAADVSLTNTDDDTAGIVVTPTAGLITSEDGETDNFTIKLTSEPVSPVSITLSSSNTNEGVVTPSSVTFTAINWATPKLVTVTGISDTNVDYTQTYTIVTGTAVSADPNYNNRVVTDVAVSNLDTTVAPHVDVETLDNGTTEAGGTGSFRIRLSDHPGNNPPNANVTLSLNNTDPTEGTLSLSTLTFTPANFETWQTIIVTGVNDFVDDGNIIYTIVTNNTVSTDPEYNNLPAADVSMTNQDDDTAGITINPSSGLVTSEGGGTDTFTIVLNSEPTASVTIGLSSNDTTEGTISHSSVTFTSGNWDTVRTITLTGVNDDVDDGDQPYSAVTAAATSSDPNYSGINPANVTATNQDNDTAGVTVNPTTGLITTEAGGTDTFTIILNSEPTANVMIGLSSNDTTEGTISPASITFTPANWNTARTVTLTGINDDVDDGDQLYTAMTGAATSTDPNYSNYNPANVTATNQDNDTAGFNFSETSGLLTTEAVGIDTFTLVLASQPTAEVTIGLSSSDTSEGTVSPGSITFTPANWNTARTVTLTGVNDDVDDDDQPYTAVTAAAVSSDLLYSGSNPSDVSAINQDNDTAAINLDPTSGLVTTEEGGTDSFTIVLASEPMADVTIDLSSSDTSEGTVLPTLVTFTSANWDTPKTVGLTGVNDNVDDDDQPYTIVTAAADSTDNKYNNINPADISATNVDDDGAGFDMDSITDLETSEAGGTDSFTVQLFTEPTAAVTIGFSSSDTSEGTVLPASLTFEVGDWNTPKTVTVTGVDDDETDEDVPYTIITAPATSGDPNYNGRNPADINVTNRDNDAAGIIVEAADPLVTSEDGTTTTFRVKLSTRPGQQVVIPLRSSDTTEGTISANSLSFTSGPNSNYDVWQEVTVTGEDDVLVDGVITYTIVISPAISNAPGYSGLDAPDLTAVNLDRDSRLYLPVIAMIPVPPPPVWEKVGNEPAGVTKFYTVATCDGESFAGGDNGLYRLSGITWQHQTGNGMPTLLVSGIAFSSNCNALFVGTRGQGTWRGDKDGNSWTWKRVDTAAFTNDNEVRAVVRRGDTIYVGTDFGIFYASSPNAPQLWNATNIDTLVTGFTLNEDNTIYAAVWGDGIYQAGPNPGDNWTEIGSISDPLVYQAAQTSGGSRRVAGTQNQFFRWNGSNWQAVNSFVATTFAVAAHNGRLFAGQRNNGVLVSDDGGLSWAAMNDEMAMPAGEEFQVRGFFIDSDGFLYAATSSGVWRWSVSLD